MIDFLCYITVLGSVGLVLGGLVVTTTFLTYYTHEDI